MEPDDFQLLMKARQNAYDLLRCFFLQEPAEPFLVALKNENILNNLIGYHKELDEGIKLISSVIFSPEISNFVPGLLQEFTRLFVGPVPVPLYESVYRSQTGLLMQQETLAVRGKYMEAGLVVNPGKPFPDDHIGAELEFVFYLCQKAAQAEDAKTRDALLEMQYRFFREHLVAWVPLLCDRLYEETESPYFKGVAKVTKGFVHWDYQEIVSHFID
ncbi:MAG: molecular chaperone TorD family protein [Proteobacteria bacterium]|nr:molecular chaperone TorD family protein [Pseudomonadota bacterium]